MPHAARARSLVRGLAEAILALAVFGLIIAVLTGLGGCNGKLVSGYVSHKVIVDPDTGREIYRRDVNTHAAQELPANAAGPTTQAVGESGTTQTLAGTHERTPEQIIAENQSVLYWIAAGFAVVSVAAFGLFKSMPLGVAALIAAAAFGLTPTFLSQVGPWLLPIAAVAVVAGIVWHIVNRQASIRSSKIAGAALAQADVAAGAGDTAQAVDLMRSATAVLAVNKPAFRKAAAAAAE